MGGLNRNQRKKRNQGGSTMVSVIVAFVLLMLAVLMLYSAVITSMNLLADARRNDREVAGVIKNFYTEFNETTDSPGTINLISTVSHYGEFEVKGNLKSWPDPSGSGGASGKTIPYYQYPK